LAANDDVARVGPKEEFNWIVDDCRAALVAAGASAADIRFNPLSWEKRGVPLADQIRCLKRVSNSTASPRLRWIVTIKRDGAENGWWRAAEFAIEASTGGVIAIDVSRSYAVTGKDGAVRRAPSLKMLVPVSARVRDAGLAVYVHCGWFDDVDDCWSAIDELGAARIGHGTPIGRDAELRRRVVRDKVTVELCPTAASRVGAMPLREHPFREWLDAGLLVVLGSDHPLELDTDIRKEHDRVANLSPRCAAQIMEISAGLGREPAETAGRR
jgi:adenosine deaminase